MPGNKLLSGTYRLEALNLKYMYTRPAKKCGLSLILFSLICVYKANGRSSYNCAKVFLKCDSLQTALEKRSSKPDLTLYIDNANVGQYTMGDPEKFLHISYFLINNSDDTLRYTGSGCLTTKFFRTDNPNITIIDNVWPKDSLIQLLIPPHRGITGYLIGKFKKRAVAAFGFKVGMRLIQWEKADINSVLNKATNGVTDMVWSDTETVETNSKHYNYRAQVVKRKAHWLKRPITAFFPPLTKDDRDKYTLSIDENKILKLRDSTVYDLNIEERTNLKRKCLVTVCPVKLSNNSNGTLEYISMDCSWMDIYKPNNNKFSVVESICFKNVPTTIEVLPHQSVTVYVPIKTFDRTSRGLKIKIGMGLYKYLGRDQFELFNSDELMQQPESNNMIWSNEVVIK